jgi:hypothetical protein
MFAWMGGTFRPTRDADMLGLGDVSPESLAKIFAEVCAVPVEPDATIAKAIVATFQRRNTVVPDVWPVGLTPEFAGHVAKRRQWDAFQQTRQARVIRNVEGYLATLDRAHPDRRFVALSLSLFPASPINEMLHAEWGSRFSCLWMLPAIMEAEERAAQGGERGDTRGRAYLEGAISEDFDRWHPDVVLVERSRQVSTLDQLLKSERFRRVWRDYRLVGRIEYFEVFERVREAPAESTSAAVEHVDAQRDKEALAAPAAPVRLQRGAQDRPLGGEAGVAPVVGAVGGEYPDSAAERR